MEEKIEVTFNKDTAFADAKSSNLGGKVYFTPDTHSIILEGEEYGGSLISFMAAPYGNNGQLVLIGENPIDANSDLNSLMQSKVEARLVIMNPGQSEYLYIPVSMKFDVSNNTVLCSGTYTVMGICKMVYFQVLVGGDIANVPIHIRDVVNEGQKEFVSTLQESIALDDNYIEFFHRELYVKDDIGSKPVSHPNMISGGDATILPQRFNGQTVYEKVISYDGTHPVALGFDDIPQDAMIINSILCSDLGNFSHTIKKWIPDSETSDFLNPLGWIIEMRDDDLQFFETYSTNRYIIVQYVLLNGENPEGPSYYYQNTQAIDEIIEDEIVE